MDNKAQGVFFFVSDKIQQELKGHDIKQPIVNAKFINFNVSCVMQVVKVILSGKCTNAWVNTQNSLLQLANTLIQELCSCMTFFPFSGRT